MKIIIFFVKGGCDGNDNNFISEDECNQNCTNLVKSVFRSRILEKCLQPPNKGMCKGNLKRYFYNDSSKQCEEFTYGNFIFLFIFFYNFPPKLRLIK